MNLQQFLTDDIALTSFNTFKTSPQTSKLKSEKNRTIFAEVFNLDKVSSLSTLCLQILAKNFSGQLIQQDLSELQLKTYYDHIDADLPLEKCVNISDEQYWKRVYKTKCTDKMLVKEQLMKNDVCWKSLAMSLKFAEIIETTPFETWIHDKMEILANLISPYVFELKINKLQAMREESFQKLSDTVSESITMTEENEEVSFDNKDEKADCNYSVENCHHINLSVIMSLKNLNSLVIEFLPPNLDRKYHTRYFNFSYVDILNLGKGISSLTNLRTFKIRRSRMDNLKLSTILEALKSISLQHLEFYFCQLNDECGECLYNYLSTTPSLQYLNLSGNYLKVSSIICLSDAIQNCPSKLTTLCLSNNPISSENFCKLTNSLLTCETLSRLTLSGIKVSQSGADCIANLIKCHSNLISLEIIAVQMEARPLIKALKENTKIQQILYQGSGFTLDEEFQIELLLKRNRFIKENPYINDTSTTKDDIIDFVNRTKNPILLNALKTIKRQRNCKKNQETLLTKKGNIETDSTSSEGDRPNEWSDNNKEGFFDSTKKVHFFK